jgi:hypothetical protein
LEGNTDGTQAPAIPAGPTHDGDKNTGSAPSRRPYCP